MLSFASYSRPTNMLHENNHIEKTETFATKHLESITVDLLHLGIPLLIANLYLTPTAPIADLFNLVQIIIKHTATQFQTNYC